MTSGIIGGGFVAMNNSTVNISGGSVGGSLRFIDSEANISNEAALGSTSVGPGSTANISGGTVDRLTADADSVVNISGGNIGSISTTTTGSEVYLIGGEFQLDGVSVPGLGSPGNSVGFDLPDGSYLTGILTDGSVFIFTNRNGDNIADGTLTLTAASVPPPGPAVFNVPADPTPLGLRAGQTLNLTDGGNLGNYFAALNATLNIAGGTVGDGMEVLNSTVSMTRGNIGQGFTAMNGSTVNLSGGSVGRGLNFFDSELNISGEVMIRSIFVGSDGTANISGGTVDRITASTQSIVNISGGSVVDRFQTRSDSTVNISGGNIDGVFSADPGSAINLIGLSFILDGVDLSASLTLGESLLITDRDVTLEGLLADGSLFSFDLNSEDWYFEDFFASDALLTVTLVPEPGTLGLLGAGALCVFRRRVS